MSCALSFPICLFSWLTRASPGFVLFFIFVYGYSFTLIWFYLLSQKKKSETQSLRADIWFNFVGPDRLGKKKIALALAEKI